MLTKEDQIQRDAIEAALRARAELLATTPLTKDDRDIRSSLARCVVNEAEKFSRGYVEDSATLLRYEATVADLETKLSSLLAERAEDTERLDWLETMTVNVLGKYADTNVFWRHAPNDVSLRALIDDERNKGARSSGGNTK